MGPGLDGGEAADDGSLGGTGEFQEWACPVHRHGDLLARTRDEVTSLHRLGDDSKPMTACRPTLGGPWDQETAVLKAPHVRDPDAVDVEVHKWIGMPGPSTDLDGPSERGAGRRLQNRGPARVEPRVPQQLRAGFAWNREFHRQAVRPRMFDLEPDPGPLDDPVDGRRLNLDRGSAGRWNRHRRRSRGDRHRVNPRLLVQVAQTVGVRIPPVRVEHEVVEVERIRGALKARGAQEADP